MATKKSGRMKKPPAPPELSDEQKIKKAIGKRIQIKRNTANLSAQTIAGHLGITRSALTLIETGRNNASGIILWKLASLLGCSVEEFFPRKSETACLTKIDLGKLKQEDDDVENWAKNLHLV